MKLGTGAMPPIGPRAGSVLLLVTAGLGSLSLGGCSSDVSGTPNGGASMSNGTAGNSSGAAGPSSGTGTMSGGSGGMGGDGQVGTGSGGASANGAGGASTTISSDGGTAGSVTMTDGGRRTGPSAGCKAAMPMDPIQKAVQHDLVVNVAPKYAAVPAYVNRKYYTTLPMNSEPAKPYPVLFYGQGCGQTGPEGGPFATGHFLSDVLYVQLIPAAVTGQTVVPSNGSPGCFQAGRQGLVDSPDGPYFDQALAEIEQSYCVDTGKVYVAGYSSGAWLTSYLACSRGNVIRATASSAGGLQHDHGMCTGGAAVLVMPGDATSIMVDGFDIGAAPARDTFIAANGCTTTMTKMLGNNNCEVHDGCAAGQVAWCPNGGHVPPSADAAWAFWSSLP